MISWSVCQSLKKTFSFFISCLIVSGWYLENASTDVLIYVSDQSRPWEDTYCFPAGSKTFQWGWGCLSPIPFQTLNVTVSGFMHDHKNTHTLGESVVIQKTFLLSILHYKYICMKQINVLNLISFHLAYCLSWYFVICLCYSVTKPINVHSRIFPPRPIKPPLRTRIGICLMIFGSRDMYAPSQNRYVHNNTEK